MTTVKKSQSNNQDKLVLSVEPRTVFGKKLKKFRRVGSIPANIYGPDFKSQAVSLLFKEFNKVYKIAHETGVIYIKLKDHELPTLIKNVQLHPVTDHILHVDFRKIDLKQKIQTDVPIKILGESEAVTLKSGVLLTQTESLLIEALPTDIPKQIDVDISSLKEINQEIKVTDLTKEDKYQIMDLGEKVIVSVVEHKEEEVAPQTAPTPAPEVITAKPEEGEELKTEEEVAEKVEKEEPSKVEEKKTEPAKKS